ncbi:MAG: bacterial Ig-like domain-containing protein [Spirochaetaceae bacterium]|jgi:hypothetical protein|nr:bacterial Ig-like domain-containing protein [Spirochaetaceae bacterium]
MKGRHVIRLLILSGCVFFLFGCSNPAGGGSHEPPPVYLSGEGLNASALTISNTAGAARYFSLVDGKEVDPYYANSGEYWDIALESIYPFLLIYTNGGASGTGGGGVTYTNKTDFEDVDIGDAVDISGDPDYQDYEHDVIRYISTMADPTPCKINVMTYYGFVSGTGTVDDPFEGSGTMIGAWDKKASYSQNPGMPPSFSPTNEVYIVTHADGVSKSKVQLTAISVVYGGTTTYTVSFEFEEAPAALESIEITTEPNIKVYPAGDDLILTGLAVEGTYSDETVKPETITMANISGYDNTTPGTQTVTVTVRGKTDTFEVEVGGEGLYWRRNNNTAAGDESANIGSFTLAAAISRIGSIHSANTTYTIILESNQNLAAATAYTANIPTDSGTKVILRGLDSERTIQLTGTGPLFSLFQGGELVLDKNITLKGVSGNDTGLIFIYWGGTLTMNEGSKITENTNTTSGGKGGGVSIPWQGKIILNGGEISGNSAESGGGVYLYDGTFTVNSGTITNNSATDGDGGGVYFTGAGEFTLTGGEISDNSATGNGGGVYVDQNSSDKAPVTFSKTGGTIIGTGGPDANTVDGDGAAVYLGSAKKRDATADLNVKLYAAVNASGVWTYDGGGTIGDTSANWED